MSPTDLDHPANDPPPTLRLATYNIHKGVQGVGPNRRLEIHNLAIAIEQFDADVVCLQEVRSVHHKGTRHFLRWPDVPQAEYLAPEGYEAVYRTNAVTRHGEHGNALLSRWPVLECKHEDMSDHRFEQRGLLHTATDVHGKRVHVIVVHFGLIPASRLRQAEQLCDYVRREVPDDAPVAIAGDFNDWGEQVALRLARAGLKPAIGPRSFTYPSRLPVVQLDHVYTRGLTLLHLHVPRGKQWARMSDHLPLIGEFAFD